MSGEAKRTNGLWVIGVVFLLGAGAYGIHLTTRKDVEEQAVLEAPGRAQKTGERVSRSRSEQVGPSRGVRPSGLSGTELDERIKEISRKAAIEYRAKVGGRSSEQVAEQAVRRRQIQEATDPVERERLLTEYREVQASMRQGAADRREELDADPVTRRLRRLSQLPTFNREVRKDAESGGEVERLSREMEEALGLLVEGVELISDEEFERQWKNLEVIQKLLQAERVGDGAVENPEE